MKNIYNINILNQIDYPDLFDPKLFDFLLNNFDEKEFINHSYSINFESSVHISGNLPAFLYYKTQYAGNNLITIIEEINKKLKLSSPPIFNVQLPTKKYQISENGFACIINFNDYFNKSVSTKPLNDVEEKLIIDLIMNDNKFIYLTLLDESGHKNFYNLLINQTPYIHSLNKNSKKNIFLENKNLKKALSLYSFEEQKCIIKSETNVDEIVEKYYKKLFSLKNFDLSSHLKETSGLEVINAFRKHSKSDKFFVWVEKLLKYGANSNYSRLDYCLKNPHSPIDNGYSNQSTKTYGAAIKEIVDLAKHIKDDYHFSSDEIFQLFLLIVKKQKHTLYISLREKFEQPDNESQRNILNKWVINNICVFEIEAKVKVESFKNLIEKDLYKNPANKSNVKIKI